MTVKVNVVEFGDRACYQMQWTDPETGRKRTKSTKIKRTGHKRQRNAAERVAADFEKELRSGQYVEPTKTTWPDFRDRYETQVLPGLASGTEHKTVAIFGWVERELKPNRLQELTTARISHLQARMRTAGLSEHTIKSHCAHLGAALRWAVSVGLLAKAPQINATKRAKASSCMKGRPLAAQEFTSMLGKLPAVVGEAAAESWRHYLWGMWWSGLRLTESMELYWDRDDKLCVDLSGRFPMLRIPAALHKSNQTQLLPVAPEFAEFLLRTPPHERTGPVFNPLAKRPGAPRIKAQRVGEIVRKVGKAAGVKVATDSHGKPKYASAHDLRRSFGERWATRVMPPVLQQLMRHEDVETTLRYYTGRNAEKTAEVLWAATGENGRGSNTFGNTAGIQASEGTAANAVEADGTRV